MRLNVAWCSLCEKLHNASQLEDGWYAVELRHNMKGADSAKRLICPDCLAKILIDKKEGVSLAEPPGV